MKKLNNKKGFTLAELLIVVAIIAVLVAISIPIFSAQLEKAREATDLANVRSAYAEIIANYLTENGSVSSIHVAAQQKQSKWQNGNGSNSSYAYIGTSIGSDGKVSVPWKTTSYVVSIDDEGKVTVN